jgi:hypothetical protein
MQSAIVESHPAHREDRSNPDGTKDAQDHGDLRAGQRFPLGSRVHGPEPWPNHRPLRQLKRNGSRSHSHAD